MDLMIEVNNLTSGRGVDEKFLKRVASLVLAQEKKEKKLSLVLVGQKRIKELNKKYRKKNRATDVLSFSYRARRSRAKVKEEDKVFFAHGDSGEVVLCPGIIRKNAKEYGLPFKKELARILIHGLLHLLGYGHQKIRKKEKCYSSKL